MKESYLNLLLNFKFDALAKTVELMTKMVAFYFAIVAVVIGYVLSGTLSIGFTTTVVNAVLLISILFALLIIALSYGVIKGVFELGRDFKCVAPEEYENTNMRQFMRRGVIVSVISALSSFLILIIIITTMYFLRNQIIKI